jgi:hypothetical protein
VNRSDEPPARAQLTLQVAAGAAEQQRALDAWSARSAAPRAVLVEAGLQPLDAPADTAVERLPAGCVCCIGSVVLRVALTRLLRQRRPASVLLLIAANTHRDRVERLLTSPPLDKALTLQGGPAVC